MTQIAFVQIRHPQAGHSGSHLHHVVLSVMVFPPPVLATSMRPAFNCWGINGDRLACHVESKDEMASMSYAWKAKGRGLAEGFLYLGVVDTVAKDTRDLLVANSQAVRTKGSVGHRIIEGVVLEAVHTSPKTPSRSWRSGFMLRTFLSVPRPRTGAPAAGKSRG